MSIIQTQNLVKEYGSITAVDGVSLSINEGEIFGLLGPNGAGKTTLISMLCTLLKPTSGSATVCGFDIQKDPDEVRKCIGLVFQDPSLDDQLTALENLDFHGRLYGMTGPDRAKYAAKVLDLMSLADRKNSLVNTFSGGMKRRLEIGRSLMHTPRVLFLDEPTIGLDPQTRYHIWEYVRQIKQSGITVILTTHYLEEAERLCDRIAIIDQGKIIAVDTPANLKKLVTSETIILQTPHSKKIFQSLASAPGVLSTKNIDGKIYVSTKDANKTLPVLLKACEKLGVSPETIELRKPSLEDAFIKFTGKEIRAEAASTRDMLKTGQGMFRRF